nr:hypothetical protein LSAT_V11C800443380 [Lactuca sativa]
MWGFKKQELHSLWCCKSNCGVANPTDLLNKLKNGIDVQDFDNTESVSLSSGDLIAQAKKFEGPLSVKANVVVEALEGKFNETITKYQLVTYLLTLL